MTSTSGTEWMVASESVAIDVLGFDFLRDVAPGEAVLIDTKATSTVASVPSIRFRRLACSNTYIWRGPIR